MYSEAGVKLISYAYDDWGNANISFHNGGENTNATKNPFTYRGYYYDQDLGLYYLQSRYYDAKVGSTGILVGRYIAPAGTPTQMLSLPYDKIGQPTTILQVQQSIEVLAG